MSMATTKSFSEQRSLSSLRYYPKLSLYLATSSITLLLLLQLQVLLDQRAQQQQSSTAGLDFMPLKNISLAATAMDGNTWFMSALNDTHDEAAEGEAAHLLFPSVASGGRLLCLSGRDARDGTRNRYALAAADALPPGSRLLRGLTFVSDTYYDYGNLWHGLSAVAPFVSWHERNGCAGPARWVLYHRGEMRGGMGPWVGSVVEAVFGRKNYIERFQKGVDEEEAPNCFEKAVVCRHNEWGMSKERKEEMYGMIRCKARAYCNITTTTTTTDDQEQELVVRMTLLLRSGPRSFKDDGAVVGIFDRVCRKVDGCRLTVARPSNLTFCDQVKVMSSTDVLASPHGAQMTNMLFMDRNSSVMEFFPKGWLELAGPGQYVFQWIADSSGMQHKGAWRDPHGDTCPHPHDDPKCFPLLYKHARIGHDEAYFANWTAKVLQETRERKLLLLLQQQQQQQQRPSTTPCPCM
ncbi:uncharacterized protein M6B38_112775 [Iris pallida]|uniref:Glycosyltransferase 61 catalytic domain-containing protein n=1 Tax=Iris pallida TaxID=29817 RepID=A0AAX6DMS9_IRIPA|nr:uncharacterized protein M6B38_112775 [Iris pallida]